MNNFNREGTNNKSVFATRFTCLVIAVLALFIFLCVVSSGAMFGGFSELIFKVTLGLLGYSAYPVLIGTILSCLIIFVRKRSFINKKATIILVALFIFVIFILHTATTAKWFNLENGEKLSYGDYISACYNLGGNLNPNSIEITGGGVISGLILYYIILGLQPVGVYIIFSFAFLIGSIFLVRSLLNKNREGKMEQRDYPINIPQANGQTVMYNNGMGINPNAQNGQNMNGYNGGFNQTPQSPVTQSYDNQNTIVAPSVVMPVQNVHHNYGTLRGNLFVENLYEENRVNYNQDIANPSIPNTQNNNVPEEKPLKTIVKPNVTYSDYYQDSLEENKRYPLKSKRYPIQEQVVRPEEDDKKNSVIGDPYKPKNILDEIREDKEFNKQIFRINIEESEPVKPVEPPKPNRNVPILSGDNYAERKRRERESGVSFSDAKSYKYEDKSQNEELKNIQENEQKSRNNSTFGSDYEDIFVSTNDFEVEEPTIKTSDIFKEEVKKVNPIIEEEDEIISPIFEEEEDDKFNIVDDFETEEELNKKAENLYKNKTEDFSNLKTSYEDDDAIMKELDNNLNALGSVLSKKTEPVKNDTYDDIDNEYEEDNFVFNAEEEKKPEKVSEPKLKKEKTTSKKSDVIDGQVTIGDTLKESSPFKKKMKPYIHPPLELLKYAKTMEADAETEQQEKIDRLNETFNAFKIDAEVRGVTQGPTVTRYEVYLRSGTVKKILSIESDIAMRLESESGIIIQAPIPGKNLLGIEVPNKVKQTVSLRSVLESPEFAKRKSDITFGLGQDIGGEFINCDIEKMPHLLVAGTTGAGKSVCLNTLLISLIYTTSPEDLRFILIDPKLVEFNMYNGLPHLLLENVINDVKKAISSFNWAVKEMERRYSLFQECRVRDLKAYNQLADKNGEAHLPKILIIVDELADLLIMGKAELEEKIMRIAQKARAAGIHLILATQRPSVDVITGVIKSNLPSRIAFKVPDSASSKTILNYGGAENLLGNGDMLYKSVSSSEHLRVQGAFVSTEEVEAIVEYVTKANESDFNAEIENEIMAEPVKPADDVDFVEDDAIEGEKELDAYFADALRMGIERNGISLSMIQRKFSVGYARAGKIIDTMEELGYVSEANGSKPRTMLITMEKFNELFGNNE